MAIADVDEFLRIEYFTIAWNSSVQRNNTNLRSLSDEQISQLKSGVYNMLFNQLLEAYENEVIENQHIKNIIRIKQKVIQYSRLFNIEIYYKISSAQKLLNVLLKFLWVSDYINEPPHCPIDRIIINNLPRNERVNWTNINDVRIYKTIINRLRNLTNHESLAQWELRIYNDYKRY